MHDLAVRPDSAKRLLSAKGPLEKVNHFVRVLGKEIGCNGTKPSRILKGPKRGDCHVASMSSMCNFSLSVSRITVHNRSVRLLRRYLIAWKSQEADRGSRCKMTALSS